MKIKLLLIALLIALSHISSFATRPMRRAFPVKQSDGTMLMVTRHECQRNLFYATSDDVALMRGEDGALYYAELKHGNMQASAVLAHQPESRTIEEQAFLDSHKLDVADAYSALDAKFSTVQNRTRNISYGGDGIGVYGESNPNGVVKSIGKVHIPVIMVEFPDRLFFETTTAEKVNRMLNEEGYQDEKHCKGSVRDYFLSQSDGLFEPSFEVVAKIKASNNYSYYGENSALGAIDIKCSKLVQEAIDSAMACNVDFSRFDDGNGVPLVSIYYAGPGEHSSYEEGCEDYIWAHFNDRTFNAGATKIRSYFVGNEVLQEYTMDDAGNIIPKSSKIDGMGVFVHEFGHALGLPDFYYTGSSNYDAQKIQSPDFWSIMDYGQYMYDGYAPIGYSAYERSMMGWLKVVELQEEGYYELHPFATDTDATQAFLLRNEENAAEYYILENRQPNTWYPALLGSGMLVFHVDFDNSKWMSNTVNNDPKRQRYTLVPADNDKSTHDETGEFTFDAFKGDLFPGTKGVTALTDDTSPSTTVYTGGKLGKPIYNIQEKNGIVTFSYKNPDLVGIEEMENASPDLLNDAVWYTIDGRRIDAHDAHYRGIVLLKKQGKVLKKIYR